MNDQMRKAAALAMLRSMSGEDEERKPLKPQNMQARILLDAREYLEASFEQKVGALLKLKTGFWHGYKIPNEALCVIVGVLDTPAEYKDRTPGDPHSHRKHDILVLYIDANETMVEILVDSRFFEPYTGEVA